MSDSPCELEPVKRKLPYSNNPYAQYMKGTIRDKLMEVQRMEEDLDLRGELQLIRAKLLEELDREDTSPKMVLAYTKEIRDLVKATSDTIDKLQGYIPVKIMPVIFRQMVEILRANIKDEALLARISVQLGRIRIPASESEASGFDRAVAEGRVPGE